MKCLYKYVVKSSIFEKIIMLLGFFSTMPLITIGNYTVFIILLYISILYGAILFLNIEIRDKIILLLFCSSSITLIVTAFSLLPTTWKAQSFKSYINFVAVLVLVCIILKIKDRIKYATSYFKGVIFSVYAQVVWCCLQILLYKIFKIDLNNIIFDKFLHSTTSTSQYKNGDMVCTGLCWNAGNLAPIMIFGYIMCKNIYFKILIVIIAALSDSATTQIGIILCIGFEFIFWLKNNKKENDAKKIIQNAIEWINQNIRKEKKIGKIKSDKKRKLIFSILTLLLSVLVIFVLSVFLKIFYQKFSSLIERFMSAIDNTAGNSSSVHFVYYSKLYYILTKISWPQKIFGLGIGCSGYPFSQFYNQYVNSIWVVESDIVDIILGRGILGFVAFYYWLIRQAQKGKAINKKYTIFFISIIISGIFYNVQFLWVILMELMMGIFIIEKRDMF